MIGGGAFVVTAPARRHVNEVLDSERSRTAPSPGESERAFAASHGCRFAVMTASGACGLQLALVAVTTNVVIQSGLKPVSLGVDPANVKVEAAAREVRVGRRW